MNNAFEGIVRLTMVIADAGGFAVANPLRAQNADAHDDDVAVPLDNPGGWIGPDDYQPNWISRRLSGLVRVNLAVRPDGRVATCEVIRPNEAAELNQVTCALLAERARFQPFSDRPKASYEASVRWRLPEQSAAPLASFSVALHLTVAPVGRVLECREERVGPVPANLVPGCAETRDWKVPIAGERRANNRQVVLRRSAEISD